ncbi:hypothetical protein DERF_000158 [Dermatophagoides farinae]|uniref:Uncharacterized protein n=1 Tax=Dermatophagoides farinae TaxID=6954 RepID=A0A922I6R8_DERFA|nr:hypothetical protein DERF_000158 [Dermatophagoides farinae]
MPQLNLYGFDMTLALATVDQVNADAGVIKSLRLLNLMVLALKKKDFID